MRGFKASRKWRSAGKYTGCLAVAVALFVLGLLIGNGTISFSRQNQPIATGLPDQLNYSSVEQVYEALKDNYDGQLSEPALIAGLKHGLVNAAGDPHTEFFTAKEAKQFNDELNNSFSGIGAELGEDKDGNLQVISPIKGFPAAKAGLKPDDIITAINGQSTSGESVDEAAVKIRGKAGTKVNLTVVRNHAQTLHFNITRANIKLPSVNSKILPGNIGYMSISTFADDTSSLAKKAAENFKKHHVNGIILDLRGNPGGLLPAAVNVSSLWLKPGQEVVQERRGQIVENTYDATGDDILKGIPTVVLINSGSASASEITAGALHDNGDARLIGVKSYGKGSVQQIINLSNGSELKVTVYHWYRPNGTNINGIGITPDQVVKLTDQDIKNNNDTQLKAAENYLAHY